MQFGLTAGGTPSTAKESVKSQAQSIKDGAKDGAEESFVETVETAIYDYLDEVDENSQVSVSCSVNVTVSPSRG